jgi:hypothetical protein
MLWVSLASQYQAGLRRGNRAMQDLANAYNHVFRGNPTKAEAEMVLADLANESGFYKVHVPGPEVSLEYETGKRAVFGRILRFIRMSQEEHTALEYAARQEALADQEGPII